MSAPDRPDSPLAVRGQPLPERDACIDLLIHSIRLWQCCVVLLHTRPGIGFQLL